MRRKRFMRRPSKFSASALVLVCAVAIAFSAINNSRAFAHVDDDYAAGEPGNPKKPSRTVKVTMSEANGTMSYDPAEIDVKKGEQIKFILKNVGTLKHEFFLDSFDHNASHKIEMQKNPEMEHEDSNAQSIEPGQQKEILWKFSKLGSFEFACLIPGHYEAGMHGKVIVK
jgi:uncharacterized cupredoxin-like copper-binding protein